MGIKMCRIGSKKNEKFANSLKRVDLKKNEQRTFFVL